MLIPFRSLFPLDITGIIHVGAHKAEELDAYLSKGIERILWIEANPYQYPLLQKRIKNFPFMHLGKFAAGNKIANTSINIASNTASSSILDLGMHSHYYPNIIYKSSVNVSMMPLDYFFESSGLNPKSFNFMNLDIQGFELEALKGAKQLLKNIDYVYTEVNIENVYENCCLIDEIDYFLSDYSLKRIKTKLTDRGWGDAFYTKNPELSKQKT